MVENKLQGTDWQEEEDTDKLWNILKQGVYESAKEILGEKETKHQDQWFDQECAEVIERKNTVRSLNNTRST